MFFLAERRRLRLKETHAGCFYQKTRDPAKPHRPTEGICTDAHGWVFSRILYSCSAAHCLVLMRSRRNGLPRIFRMRRVVWENVTRWACLVCEKSVEICEICGRQISAQCAKEQAECIYSPTDRTRRFSQKPCGVPLSKKNGLHRCARMGLFTDSLLLLRCLPLGV